MVNLNHPFKTDISSRRIDYLFYFSSILLAAIIFSYFIFNFKVYLQNQRVQDIEKKSLELGSGDSQLFNKKILDYKRKIDDFKVLFGNRKITSNIFDFIEKSTLKNVWFSDFNMQEDINELRLSGEAESMETLSRQVEVFEESQDFVESIRIFSSQANLSGKVNFTLDMSLNSQLFNAQPYFLGEL